MSEKYKGKCFCGMVEIEVAGSPVAMGYCHCSSCRSYSGGPVNAFTLWKAEDVKVTRGSEVLHRFSKTPFSVRRFCANCGGHVLVDHPTLGLVDVHASTIPGLAFKPAVHLNYVETVLPMRDALPKLKDFPVEAGGSGDVVPES